MRGLSKLIAWFKNGKAWPKRLLWMGIGVLIFVSGLVAWNFPAFLRFRPNISSYYSKEMCSCLFVLQQDEKFCRRLTEQYFPFDSMVIDPESKSVLVSAMGFQSKSQWVDSRLGCLRFDQNKEKFN